MRLSIIIPVLNEEEQVVSFLKNIRLPKNFDHEIIVVDGGSVDNSYLLAKPFCNKILKTNPSRSLQMNAGAEVAEGQYLLFLHADTHLPDDLEKFIEICRSNEHVWGRFSIRLSGQNKFFRVIEFCMNLRSKLTGIATGDQAIFVNRLLFERVQGYPKLALMEDIALSKNLNKLINPICLENTVVSSSRRWESNGIFRTILKMWLLRLLYLFDMDTAKLARYYQ